MHVYKPISPFVRIVLILTVSLFPALLRLDITEEPFKIVRLGRGYAEDSHINSVEKVSRFSTILCCKETTGASKKHIQLYYRARTSNCRPLWVTLYPNVVIIWIFSKLPRKDTDNTRSFCLISES